MAVWRQNSSWRKRNGPLGRPEGQGHTGQGPLQVLPFSVVNPDPSDPELFARSGSGVGVKTSLKVGSVSEKNHSGSTSTTPFPFIKQLLSPIQNYWRRERDQGNVVIKHLIGQQMGERSMSRTRFLVHRRSQRDVVYFGWLIAPSYKSPNEGGGLRGLSQWVQLCTWSPNKLHI